MSLLSSLLASSSSVPKDAYFRNVTLLLHGDGSNGAQNNTFLDSSSNNFTITRNGNTTQGSFTPYGTRWSNYFDGSGDYLTAPDNAPLQLGSSDFTIEFWVNFSSVPGASQGATLVSKFDTSNTGYEVILFNNTLYFQAQSADIGLTYAWTPTAGRWYHIAWSRSGANSYGFIDGVLVASTSAASGAISNLNQALQLGRRGDNTFYLNGYLSDVRVVKGTAVYTAAFTPPTVPLTAITNTSLLTCQSNRFRDASTNNFAITRNGDVRVTPFSPYAPTAPYSAGANGGSMYFDGSGDYLGVTPSALSTGDFTFECWIYATGTGQYQYIYDTRASANDAAGFCVIYNHASYPNQISIYSNGFIGTPTITVSANTWTHFALVRSGGSWRTFVNGVADIASTSASRTLSNVALKIGTGQALDYFFNGYLSNYRIVTSAVYTANFTPPTSPVTVITNTSLLLNATNAAIVDSAADNDLETVGNAQISTSVKKFGTGSIFINGSGNYLTAPNSDLYAFGTGDFTVECWFKSSVSSQNTHATMLGCYQSSVNGTWALKVYNNVAAFASFSNNTWYDWNTSTNVVADQQWHHIAATRSGTTLRVFVDGVVAGTWSSVTNNLTTAGHPLTVGWMQQDTASPLQGYLDDIRITKGVARYTANFTPPTAAFANQ